MALTLGDQVCVADQSICADKFVAATSHTVGDLLFKLRSVEVGVVTIIACSRHPDIASRFVHFPWQFFLLLLIFALLSLALVLLQ